MQFMVSLLGIKAKFPSLSKWFAEISDKSSLREVVAQYSSPADTKSILSRKTELVMVEFQIRVGVSVCQLSEAIACL